MCQLTLFKSNIKEVIAPSLIHLLLENTDYKNRDGAGMYSASAGIIKTEKQFNEISWRNFFNKNTSNTVLAHVRAATFSSSGKREITLQNSHPYSINGTVLAHNGTLKLKSEVKLMSISEPEDTDSLVFLKELAVYKKKYKVSFPVALKKVMESFTGKFAFLASDLNNFYVIRGKTAPLHKAVILQGGNPVGLVINTEERDLKNCLPLILHLFSLYSTEQTTYEFSEVTKETINIVKDFDIDTVDEIKENDPPTVITVATTYDDSVAWGHSKKGYNQWYNRSRSLDIKLEGALSGAIEVLIGMNLTPEQLDRWSVAAIGKPVLTLTTGELLTLIYFIDDYKDKVRNHDPIVNSFTSNKEKAGVLLKNAIQVAEEGTIHFPYELNSVPYLLEIIKRGETNNDIQQQILL